MILFVTSWHKNLFIKLFMKKAKENDKVKVHYTGSLEDGEVFDSSKGKDPLEFTLGQGQVIKGFDDGVMGMEVNEKKTIQIPAEQAYGTTNEELIQEVPKSQLSDGLDPKVGMNLITKTSEGKEIPLVITEVKNETIVVDANHPLAGKDLTFEVTLVEIL